MPAALSLSALAKPRDSAFGFGRADTVAEIADLPRLDAAAFFAETHITEGMGVLLRQVFDRLMGRSDQGVFRLKQAMGGGKTHNLLAAALLAREPAQRKAVLQRIGVAADDRPIRVAAFSGPRDGHHRLSPGDAVPHVGLRAPVAAVERSAGPVHLGKRAGG
jgi:hypothetical protein